MSIVKKDDAEIFHRMPVESQEHRTYSVTTPYREIERYEMPAFMARITLYVCASILLISLIWSAIARVDVVAEAPGQTVPRLKVRPIQPEADGVVDALFVKEGQKVVAGQKLLVLDLTAYNNDLLQRQRDMDLAVAQSAQLDSAAVALKQIIEEPSRLPDMAMDVAGVGSIVSRVHAASVQAREAESDSSNTGGQKDSESSHLKSEITNLAAERASEIAIKSERMREFQSRLEQNRLEGESLKKLLSAGEEEVVHLQSILEKTLAEESAFRMLMGQGAVSRVDHFRIERDVSRVRQEIARQKANVAELQKKIEIAKSTAYQLRAEKLRAESEQDGRARRIAANLNEVNIQLRNAKRHNVLTHAELAAALSAAKAALSRVETDKQQTAKRVDQCRAAVELALHNLQAAELKSPLNGLVTNISVKGRGQVVRRGDQLMSVIPEKSDMLIECQVSSKDIGFVEPGQEAKLKLTAFPFEDFGVVRGRVLDVAKESHSDPSLGLVYKTTVEPERQWIKARGKKISFASGMGVTCEIVTRQRSVLNIILEPVKRLKDTRWL